MIKSVSKAFLLGLKAAWAALRSKLSARWRSKAVTTSAIFINVVWSHFKEGRFFLISEIQTVPKVAQSPLIKADNIILAGLVDLTPVDCVAEE